MAMSSMKKRTRFYLGLGLITIAIIFIAYVIFTGPHTQIPETEHELIYDHPTGPSIDNVKPGDRFELNFESTEKINILLMKREDAGNYFNTPTPNVQPIILDSDSTGGYFEHTFDSGGDWRVYFDNPHPPTQRNPSPTVKYWGQIIRQDDDYFYYYMKLALGTIVLVLGAAFLISSREVKARKSDKKAGKTKDVGKSKKVKKKWLYFNIIILLVNIIKF